MCETTSQSCVSTNSFAEPKSKTSHKNQRTCGACTNQRQMCMQCVFFSQTSRHIVLPLSEAKGRTVHAHVQGRWACYACKGTLRRRGMRAAASSKRSWDTRNSRYCPATCMPVSEAEFCMFQAIANKLAAAPLSAAHGTC